MNEFKYKLNNLLFNWNNGFNYSFNRVGKYSKQRLFIEEYIESCDNQVYDYKFLYFHGELKIFWIDVDRYKKHCRVFFELKDGNPVVLYNFSKIKNPYELIPKNFDKMKTLAKKAAKEFPHVRVDFYDLGDRVLFGEFTFTTNSALSYNMFPRELDEKLGEYLDLTKLNPKYLLKNDKK